MRQNLRQFAWITPGISILCLSADITTKSWALANLHPGQLLPFIPWILNLTLTTNIGGAFGLGNQCGWLMTVLAITLSLGLLIYVIYRERSSNPPSNLERLGLGLVLGGALGNIFDRIVLGQVTDFLSFAFVSFPIFNLADALIDVGVAIIIFNNWYLHFAKPEKPTLTRHD